MSNQTKIKAPAIGIDLGTTYSCVAVRQNNTTQVLENAEGQRTTPSFVSISKDGDIVVGGPSKRQAVADVTGTIFASKRFMGRKYNEASVQELSKVVPFKVEKGKDGYAGFKVHNKFITPEEVGSHILSKMKASAETYLGQEVSDAVITVPAYFNDSERQATANAGKIAGLNVLRIINEPTAAALAYGIQDKLQDSEEGKNCAVFDLGGGTFDVSILEIAGGVFEVKSTNGDTALGGEDFDNAILKYLIEKFRKDEGIDLSQDVMALQRLKDAAEKAKIELSSTTQTDITLPFISGGSSGPKHLNIQMTRAKFENLIGDLVRKTLEPCKQALKDAQIETSEIDEVILVGGSTRIPMVVELVKEFFGRKPHQGVNPDEVVALGAAIQASILSGDTSEVLLLDVTPLSLGIETLGGVFSQLIERNTTIPTKKSQVFSTAEDNQSAVTIKVYQGERQMATDNKLLGLFTLEGIPPAPRGIPQIEVTFDIDANGIAHVSAKDKGTGKEQSVTIQSSGGLSDSDIEKMIKESEAKAEEDRVKKDMIEARNTAESSIYTAEKTLKEHADKIKDTDKSSIENEIESLKKIVAKDDIEEIKQNTDKLSNLVMKIGAEVYQASAGSQEQASQGNTTSSTSQEDEGKVVDSEYEESDNDDDKNKE